MKFNDLKKQGFSIRGNRANKFMKCKDDNSYIDITYIYEFGEIKMNLEFNNYPVDKNGFLSILDTIMDEKITWLGNENEEEFEKVEKELEK